MKTIAWGEEGRWLKKKYSWRNALLPMKEYERNGGKQREPAFFVTEAVASGLCVSVWLIVMLLKAAMCPYLRRGGGVAS